MKKGDIDALSNIDPMMTKLEQDGDIKVVADSRTEDGTRAILATSNPASVLYFEARIYRAKSEHRAGAGHCVLQNAAMAGQDDG